MLKRTLEGLLGEKSDEMISAFDQIGDIIIVRIPDSLLPEKDIIGRTLLSQVKTARSVFYQSSAVAGDHRTRNLEILAGVDAAETIYKESGCRFAVDVRDAFFSPRLSTERDRIAGLARDGETILNMFAGIGMFSIIAAKRCACRVYSIDINPRAIELCRESMKLNRMQGEVIPICGDAQDVIRQNVMDASDRTLMLLPERSDHFLDSAIQATRDGGTIHYYSHIHADRKADAAGLSERHLAEISGIKLEMLRSKIVRPVGPRYYQTVVDARIAK